MTEHDPANETSGAAAKRHRDTAEAEGRSEVVGTGAGAPAKPDARREVRRRTTPLELKTELARRLRQARRQSGLSKMAVYRATGIAPRTLQAYEHASHLPGAWAMRELARLYAVSSDWLLQLRPG